MDDLKLPEGPRKRSSTNQLGREYHKRTETGECRNSVGDDTSDPSKVKLKLAIRERHKGERTTAQICDKGDKGEIETLLLLLRK